MLSSVQGDAAAVGAILRGAIMDQPTTGNGSYITGRFKPSEELPQPINHDGSYVLSPPMDEGDYSIAPPNTGGWNEA